MTDREYEKMMVEAVNSGVDISHVMYVLNTKIAVAEQMVESLYETRGNMIAVVQDRDNKYPNAMWTTRGFKK